MICTTLNKIREHAACADGWQKLLAGLNKSEADDEPLPLVRILDINGLDDALWALRTTDCDRESRLLAVAYARQVRCLMAAQAQAALDVAQRFANGQATREELAEARVAADAAARAAMDAVYAAANAAYAAARTAATYAAARAARAAVNAEAASAAVNAADAAANAAAAAVHAVEDAEWGARDAAMREKQVSLFKEILG